MTHYQRWRRNGDAAVTRKRGTKIGEGFGRSESPGYISVHHRLYRERGKASEYRCAICDEPAHTWAFDEPTGYSTDLSRYRPLCWPCHAAVDDFPGHFRGS